MGKGGGGDTTSTVYQSNLPQYARPYYEQLMTRATAESDRPYQTYEGDRLAGMSDDTRSGLNLANYYSTTGTPQLNQASNMTNYLMGNNPDLNYQSGNITENFNPTGYNSGYNATNFTNTYRPTDFENTYTANTIGGGVFNNQAAQQYMSPYMDAVTAAAQRDAVDKAQQEQLYRDSDAARAGAFGGSRAAVQRQIATGQLQNRLSDITVQGRQSAFENAQQQFERDRQARFGAAQFNDQSELNEAQLGLQAQQAADASRQFGSNLNLQTQQAGDASRLNAEQARLAAYNAAEQSRQFGSNLNLEAQRANEQARQGAAGIRNTGRVTSLGAADQLARMQQQRDDMMLSRIQARLGVGQTREDYEQQGLDMAYNDFVNQRDAERQNLQFLSSILQGVPISANQDVTQTGSTNPLAGVAGTLTGLQALYALRRGS